jgi:hypothetical protein
LQNYNKVIKKSKTILEEILAMKPVFINGSLEKINDKNNFG